MHSVIIFFFSFVLSLRPRDHRAPLQQHQHQLLFRNHANDLHGRFSVSDFFFSIFFSTRPKSARNDLVVGLTRALTSKKTSKRNDEKKTDQKISKFWLLSAVCVCNNINYAM